MQFIQVLASYRLRMTPYQVLAASTVNSSFAIGLGDRKGRIVEGFDADMIVLKDGSFDHVVYHFGLNHVDKVIKGGKLLLNGVGW